MTHTKDTTTHDKAQIVSALYKWVNSRPGFDPNNYDRAGYLSDSRMVQRQRKDALTLLRAIEWRDSITGDMLAGAFRAFSGRLTWDGEKLSYCAGQYYCTEYRAAACAVLASCLWGWVRDCAMPKPETVQYGSATDRPMSTETRYDGLSAGDWLRRHLRREFGRSIQSRWFD